MSEHTLKKKSIPLYSGTLSHGAPFSLSGCLRNLSYVGKPSIINTQARTRMNGNKPRGTGFVPKTIVVAKPYYNNPSVIKPATLNSIGALKHQFKWAYSASYPNYVVDPQQTGDYLAKWKKYNKPMPVKCSGCTC